MDKFGKPMPTFNIGGKTVIQTLVGGLCSFFILLITFVFGLLKL